MIRDVKKLNVKYNGKLVGYLATFENGKIGFQYDYEWIKTGFSISPFSLPLKNDIFISQKDTFDGLYGVFWDSLPDGWGELLVNRMLAKKGINYKNLSPLTRLSIINKNGLGGLCYEPEQTIKAGTEKYNLDELSKEADRILNDEGENINLDDIYRFGGSSGGARPKAHIKENGEEWIVKFPCRIDPINVGEREYLANKAAKNCGINVNEYKLFPSKICSGYFGAKRFDRVNGKRLHVISLAGMLEISHRTPVLDYGHLFDTVSNLNCGKEDLYEVFRRMCFNVYYGNKDDHAKNFAFIYDEKAQKYILSPAYDITRTENKFEHEMTVNGNGNPTDDDILTLAKDFGLSLNKCKAILENIKANSVIFYNLKPTSTNQMYYKT